MAQLPRPQGENSGADLAPAGLPSLVTCPLWAASPSLCHLLTPSQGFPPKYMTCPQTLVLGFASGEPNLRPSSPAPPRSHWKHSGLHDMAYLL